MTKRSASKSWIILPSRCRWIWIRSLSALVLLLYPRLFAIQLRLAFYRQSELRTKRVAIEKPMIKGTTNGGHDVKSFALLPDTKPFTIMYFISSSVEYQEVNISSTSYSPRFIKNLNINSMRGTTVLATFARRTSQTRKSPLNGKRLSQNYDANSQPTWLSKHSRMWCTRKSLYSLYTV